MADLQQEPTASLTEGSDTTSSQGKKVFKKDRKKSQKAGEPVLEPKIDEKSQDNADPEDRSTTIGDTSGPEAHQVTETSEPDVAEAAIATSGATQELTQPTDDQPEQTELNTTPEIEAEKNTLTHVEPNLVPVDVEPEDVDQQHVTEDSTTETPATLDGQQVRLDATDILVALQEDLVPLLAEPKQNKLTILQTLDRQTQVLKEVDSEQYLFANGVRDLERKLYAMDMFISGVSSIIDCDVIIAFSEFLLQTNKITELFNRFIE